MVREPCAGTVKKRLARTIGTVAAAHWYRHNCMQVIRRLANPRWQTILAVAPDKFAGSSVIWPSHVDRIPQGNGDLGIRMRRVFRKLPPGPLLLIGSDIPMVTANHIWYAFRNIDGHTAVFGPSPDGGYWLVGLGNQLRNSAHLFENVRWSSEHALADSIASLRGVRTCFTTTLVDVDTAEDLSIIEMR